MQQPQAGVGKLFAGDLVNTDDVIAVIETDKVSIDLRYTGSKPGILKSLQISSDQEVEVDQVVGVVDDDAAGVEAAGGASPKPVRSTMSVHPGSITLLYVTSGHMCAICGGNHAGYSTQGGIFSCVLNS